MKLIEQATAEQLKCQQKVLSFLGFYKGKIDGIWGPKTIAAKKEFERSGFGPGIPNNGLPFQGRPPYPKGVTIENGLLTCSGFDESKLMQNAPAPVVPVYSQPSSPKVKHVQPAEPPAENISGNSEE